MTHGSAVERKSESGKKIMQALLLFFCKDFGREKYKRSGQMTNVKISFIHSLTLENKN